MRYSVRTTFAENKITEMSKLGRRMRSSAYIVWNKWVYVASAYDMTTQATDEMSCRHRFQNRTRSWRGSARAGGVGGVSETRMAASMNGDPPPRRRTSKIRMTRGWRHCMQQTHGRGPCPKSVPIENARLSPMLAWCAMP